MVRASVDTDMRWAHAKARACALDVELQHIYTGQVGLPHQAVDGRHVNALRAATDDATRAAVFVEGEHVVTMPSPEAQRDETRGRPSDPGEIGGRGLEGHDPAPPPICQAKRMDVSPR